MINFKLWATYFFLAIWVYSPTFFFAIDLRPRRYVGAANKRTEPGPPLRG